MCFQDSLDEFSILKTIYFIKKKIQMLHKVNQYLNDSQFLNFKAMKIFSLYEPLALETVGALGVFTVILKLNLEMM